MYFDGAELTIYTSDGNNVSVSLEKLQTEVMLKSIGFSLGKDEFYTFGNDTLEKILNGKINPFVLKEI